EWNPANPAFERLAPKFEVGVANLAQGGEEEEFKPRFVDVFLWILTCLVPQRIQVVGSPIEVEPSLALQEVEEHQTVEKRLAEQLSFFIIRQRRFRQFHDLFEDARVLLEESFGNGFHVVSTLKCGSYVQPLLQVLINTRELLGCSTERLAAVDDHAAENGAP